MHVEDDADPSWVAELTGRALPAAESAVEEARADRRLFDHLEREHRREGRSSYVEIDAPLELYALVRLLRPRHVVEAGVSSGVSSAYLLRALERNRRGALHSVDLPSHPRSTSSGQRFGSWTLPPNRSSGWAVPAPLRPRWDLRLGDKATVVPFLADQLPRIDLLVYDVPHDEADLDREFALLDRRMPTGAVAIVDHGPSGDLCVALRRWARRRGASPVRRRGLGLYGMRCRGRPDPRLSRASPTPRVGA
jgi:hypothetical protein